MGLDSEYDKSKIAAFYARLNVETIHVRRGCKTHGGRHLCPTVAVKCEVPMCTVSIEGTKLKAMYMALYFRFPQRGS